MQQFALAYYFEKVADGVDYSELKAFRERAEALKELSDNADYINAIDALILAAGSATTHIPTYTLQGQHNALVASYRLYGDVSKAYEILELSSGVSGANINEVVLQMIRPLLVSEGQSWEGMKSFQVQKKHG